MRFRPALVPTLFVAVGLTILVNLGAWQLRRNVERKTRLATVEGRLTAPVATGDDLTADPTSLMWRKASLTGHFVDEGPYYFTGRYEFEQPGYDLLQPFTVVEGPTLLVNRGWIPTPRWQELTRSTAPGTGETTIHGLLMTPLGDADSRILPATATAPQRFLPDEYASVRAHLEVDTLPLILVAGDQYPAGAPKSREGFPVSGYVPTPKQLPHLQYAATWLLIAATLLVMWIAAGFRRGQQLTEG